MHTHTHTQRRESSSAAVRSPAGRRSLPENERTNEQNEVRLSGMRKRARDHRKKERRLIAARQASLPRSFSRLHRDAPSLSLSQTDGRTDGRTDGQRCQISELLSVSDAPSPPEDRERGASGNSLYPQVLSTYTVATPPGPKNRSPASLAHSFLPSRAYRSFAHPHPRNSRTSFSSLLSSYTRTHADRMYRMVH